MQGKEQIGYEEHIRRFKQRSVCAAGEIEILEVEDGEKRSDPDIAGAYQHIQKLDHRWRLGTHGTRGNCQG